MAATLLLAVTPAQAAEYTVTPSDNWIDTLQGLQAGDTLEFSAGTYQAGGFIELDLQGTEQQPIVIKGDPSGERPVIQGSFSQNTFNVGGSWYTWEYLELVGGSHGIRVQTSDHGTLRDLKIHGTGDVGISMNIGGSTYDHMHVTGCEIYETSGKAEGMYIGCNDGGCVVSNSVFDFNYIHDTTGGEQGDGIELKKNSWGNTIADNVIVNTKYPAITVYGFSEPGAPPNIVERNFVWQTVDNGIQVNGQVIVRNNVVIDAGANGIHSKPTAPHVPEDLVIVHNTIINAAQACLKTNDWDQGTGQLVANNAFYCPNGNHAIRVVGQPTDAVMVANAIVGGLEGSTGETLQGAMSDFTDPGARDFYPTAGSTIIDAGVADHGVRIDFNGTPRDTSVDIGAFEWTAEGGPNVVTGTDFKPALVVIEPPAGDPGPEPVPDEAPEAAGDAGPQSDAGSAPDAAGTSGDDLSTDVATAPTGGTDDEGCSTGTRDTSLPLGLLLVALVVVARRRSPGLPMSMQVPD